MKPLLAALLLVALATPAAAQTEDRSAGCWDGDEPGLRNAWGECITAAEYADLFSTDALEDTPALVDPTRSVVDVTPGLVTDPLLRPLQSSGPGPTFPEVVRTKTWTPL